MDSDSLRGFALMVFGVIVVLMIASPNPTAANRRPYVTPQDLQQSVLGSSTP